MLNGEVLSEDQGCRCPLILSPTILVRALRGDPAHLLVRAEGGKQRLALRALFSMTLQTHPSTTNEWRSQSERIGR